MTFAGMKTRMASHSSKRANLTDIPNVLEKVNIAMTRVCRNTIPVKLVKGTDSNRNIYRRISQDHFICVPTEVKDDNSEIEMDNYLLDAVALFALAGIETARAPSYMKMYWEIIESNENNLIESDLSLETVFLQDFVNDAEHSVVLTSSLKESTDGIM